MTLQGFLHADDYGSAPSMFGGMGLSMSVWQESLAESTRTMFWGRPRFVGLPRVIVQAALRETTRHPGIHTVPALRRALESHERAWAAIRDAEIAWMLAHADLVGAVLMEPDGRSLWMPWSSLINTTEAALSAAREKLCAVPRLSPVACAAAATTVTALETELGRLSRGERAWRAFLEIRGPIEVAWWWRATRMDPNVTVAADTVWTEWTTALSRLHNVSDPQDPRVIGLRGRAAAIAVAVTAGGWEQRVVESLLLGELWANCLSHVSAREGRVRELMTEAGVTELFTAHERALNASLRVVKGTAEEQQIQAWFSEIAGYAWWLGDDIPGLVRRCLAQQTGDCARAGPTEIAALSAQMDERARIVEDWSRRLFVGMWNALPAVAVLFIVEIVLICVDRRSPAAVPLQQEPRTIILQLQGPSGQVVAERQMIAA